MRERRDSAHVQVLEAVLIAMIMLGAVGFVLTFSLPTAPEEPVRQGLDARARQALAVMNELPVDDVRYGDNALSSAVAKALEGDTDELEARLRSLLPTAAKFNVYVHNGHRSYEVYSSGSPRGQTVTATHVFEPAWSHTFVDVDAGSYSIPSTVGVYALPAYNSNVIDDGGVPVEVTAEFSRAGDHWTARAIYTTIGGAKDDAGDWVGVSIYGSDATGAPKPYYERIDSGGVHSGETTVYLTVKATEDGVIPAGTRLLLRIPQGQEASYTVGSGVNEKWQVVPGADSTDLHRGGTLEALLDTDLADGQEALFEFESVYDHLNAANRRPYDFYVIDATLSGTRHGKAEIVLQDARSAAFTGGDYVDVYASVPKPMGYEQDSVWTVVVTNPAVEPPADAGEVNTWVRLEKVEIRQPDGIPLFAGVVDEPGNVHETAWTVSADGDALVWLPEDTPLPLSAGRAIAWTLEVTPNEQVTRNDARDYLTVPVTVSSISGPYTQNLTRRVEPGLFFGHVPPQTGTFPGYASLPSTDNPVVAAPTYRGTTIEGAWTYDTVAGSTKDLFSTATLDVLPREVPVGTRAEVEINVENLVASLLDRGLAVETRTRIYPPWSMNTHTAIFDRTTLDSAGVGKDVTALVARDVTNDGVVDVILGTSGGRLLGFDVANDGALISGLTRTFPNHAVAAISSVPDDGPVGQPQTLRQAGVRATSADPQFVVGLSAKDGAPTTFVLDEAFLDALPPVAFEAGAHAVTDVASGFDLDGDGYLDWAVGNEQGSSTVYDGSLTDEQEDQGGDWPKRNTARPAFVDWGYTGPEEGPTFIATNGVDSKVRVTRTVDQVNTTNPEENDLPALILDAAKSVQFETASDGLQGWDAEGGLVWAFPGGGFTAMQAIDLNLDGATDLALGAYDGWVYAANGEQPSFPWEGMSILSGSQITDADFVDVNHGWVVDESGFSMATTDGFNTRNYTNTQRPVVAATGVDLVDRNVGFAVGAANTIWRTTTGGRTATLDTTWDIVNPLSGASAKHLWGVSNFRDVAFLDASRGVIVGQACTGVTCVGRALPLVTADGGAKWTYPAFNPYTGTGATVLNRVEWASSTRVFAVGDMGRVIRSDDAGVRWYDKSPAGSGPTNVLHGVDCPTPDVCWVVGTAGQAWRTTDAGAFIVPWEPVDLGFETTFKTVAFYNATHGIIAGEDNLVFLTRDGGEHWVLTPGVGPTLPDWNAAVFVEPEAGMFFGGNTTTRATAWMAGYRTHAVAQSTRFVDLDAAGWAPDAEIVNVRIDPRTSNAATTSVKYHVSANDGDDFTLMTPDTPPDPVTTVGWKNMTLPEPGRHLKAKVELFTDLKFKMLTPIVRAFNVTYIVKTACPGGVLEACTFPAGANFLPASKASWCDTATQTCFQRRNATLDIGGGSHRDAAKTTAVWASMGGGTPREIRLPTVEKFWAVNLAGRVNDLDASRDVNGDGWRDVAVAVGPRMDTANTHVEAWDVGMTVHLLDGATGRSLGHFVPEQMANLSFRARAGNQHMNPEIPARAVAEPWRIKLADIGVAGTEFEAPDGRADIVLTIFDHVKESTNGTSRVLGLALNASAPTGISALDEIFLLGRADILRVVDVDEADGPDDDFIVATTAFANVSRTDQIVPGYAYVFAAKDLDSEEGVWTLHRTIAADHGGAYVIPWDVDVEAPYGPYVAEAQVTWTDEFDHVQTMTLVDYFVVTPPSGRIPIRPVYTLQLIAWFEDWDHE